ncbi:ABC transporter permease [Natronosporangium hydrolyticum]|uniref:ABC transporter permease n=1 Tax=Natronosporangium hydrolyticum TaxID=2811111 RepID=A0A895Y4N8_9ACTN|nr:ABC transporter permease [Natronosporangium hydrolyticum]QSB12664.1 ABC transporter permease [Natronosporangium hydrolyticum]
MRTGSAPTGRRPTPEGLPEAISQRTTPPRGSPASRQLISNISVVVLPLLGLSIAVGGWWGYVVAFDVAPVVLPAPPDVVRSLIDSFPYLMEHARITLTQSTVGFGLAVGGGMLLGTLIAHSRIVERMTYPWLVAFNAIPKVALAPLLVIWLGFGMQPRIAMVILICFFPVIIATVTGLGSTPSELAELAKSLDGSKLKTFVKIRFPYALPQIFIGLKVAMPLAVIGSVIGEFSGGRTGLGYVIVQASTNKALAFAALVVLSIMSVALFYALVLLERLLLPWVKATTA